MVITKHLGQFREQDAEVGVGREGVGHAQKEEVMLLKQASVCGISFTEIFKDKLMEPIGCVHEEAVVSVGG